jgi:hypothetical protein
MLRYIIGPKKSSHETVQRLAINSTKAPEAAIVIPATQAYDLKWIIPCLESGSVSAAFLFSALISGC